MLGVLLPVLAIIFLVLRLIFREHELLLSLRGMLFCALRFFSVFTCYLYFVCSISYFMDTVIWWEGGGGGVLS